MTGLVMIKKYLDEILNGEKTNDVRSYYTNKRGKIALVNSSNMKVYGVAYLSDVKKITFDEYINWHKTIYKNKDLIYKNIDANKTYYSYNFSNVVKFKNPIIINCRKQVWIEFDENLLRNAEVDNSLF